MRYQERVDRSPEPSQARHLSALPGLTPKGWIVIDAQAYRLSPRTSVSVGDHVAVLPSAPGRRDGFAARLTRLRVGDDGALVEFEVFGAQGSKAPATRTYVAARLGALSPSRQKVAQQVAEERREKIGSVTRLRRPSRVSS